MLVQLYIYRKSDGVFLYQDMGNPEYVINDISDDNDFTLTAPPMDGRQYRWIDGKWE